MKKFFVLILLLPSVSLAHSFGEIYNLPVPFSLYVYGSLVAVIISFLFFIFWRHGRGVSSQNQNIRFNLPSFLTGKIFKKIVRGVVFLIFLLTIVSGYVGKNEVYLNFNMTFFWVVFLIGFTYVCIIFGNLYDRVNPFKVLTNWLFGEENKPLFIFKEKFYYYPALIFYFILVWFELTQNITPHFLSIALVFYLVITYVGVWVLGSRVWYNYCDFFNVFFKTVSTFSPFSFMGSKVSLASPFANLKDKFIQKTGQIFFVMLLLSSTVFDGLSETSFWFDIYWNYLEKFLTKISHSYSYVLFDTLGIVLTWLCTILIYLIFVFISKIVSKSEKSFKELALGFALCILPVALTYHIAHYFTLLFTEAPSIISLFSDPFGLKTNFFETAGLGSPIFLPAKIIWNTEVLLIIFGHIIGVYVGHVISVEIIQKFGKKIVLSELPLLFIVLIYTVVGLWVLAEPLVVNTL